MREFVWIDDIHYRTTTLPFRTPRIVDQHGRTKPTSHRCRHQRGKGGHQRTNTCRFGCEGSAVAGVTTVHHPHHVVGVVDDV